MFNVWRCKCRLIMVEASRSKDWNRTQLNGSRRIIWYIYEDSVFLSPGQSQSDQLEDGCKDEIWDPGSHHENQFWELISWREPHQILVKMVGTSDNQLKDKHSWRLKDGYRHKPP
ncbi:hypothetical protein AHAS_Ahas14G0134500 [Arachis hypogaea]